MEEDREGIEGCTDGIYERVGTAAGCGCWKLKRGSEEKKKIFFSANSHEDFKYASDPGRMSRDGGDFRAALCKRQRREGKGFGPESSTVGLMGANVCLTKKGQVVWEIDQRVYSILRSLSIADGGKSKASEFR